MSPPDPSFILDLWSRNGRRLLTLPEHDGGIALHEWTTWLRIRSDVTGFVPPAINPEDDELTGFVPPVFEQDGLAVLTTVRNNADLSGESIGLFHGRLDPGELEQLRETIESTPWVDLPRPAGGDYNAPKLALAYERGPLMIRREFNARSGNFLEAIAPVWRLLDRYLMRVRKSAASSLDLQLEVEPAADNPLALEIRLALRVPGIGHVVLTDPRVPAPEGEAPRLRVRVGERDPTNPHARPHGWVELPIPVVPADGPSTLVLRPHARVRLSLPWVAPRPGAYVVEATWKDYRGPLDAAPGQSPFMPLPAQGPSSLGSGPYPIRGAVFATHQIDV